MATLRIQVPGEGTKVYHLYKKITSLGRGRRGTTWCCPTRCSPTPTPTSTSTAATSTSPSVEKDGEIHVNGKKRNKHRLIHEDRMTIGSGELTFALYDEPVTDDEAAKTIAELDAYRKLFEFSEKLMGSYDLRELLDALMDAVIEVTNADKGFLILIEGERAATSRSRATCAARTSPTRSASSPTRSSRRWCETSRPVIVSDALHDARVQAAQA